MKPINLIFLAVIALASCKDDNNNDDNAKRSVSEPDKTFAMNAAMANQAEIQLSQLASDHSTNADVQGFASHMTDEHTTALNELKTIIGNTSLTVSYDLDSAHKALQQKLSALQGIAFDTVFMNNMVKDHMKVIDQFSAESTNGKDNELKAYAAKYLPHLNEHLARAKEVQSSVLASSSTNNGRKGND
jgi:putative membrane protein